ncbi:MAG: histidine--tRNA ligase [Rhodobacteraceae bacterium]|nr:histidine--tRNA ligase [Paracoccaceae bacterium]
MAKRKPKVMRPKALPPRGFRDYFGEDLRERAAMLDKITGVYHAYGFDPLETSAVETVEALGSHLPDVDRPNAGVFAWRDDDDSGIALRYDLTAPLARVYAQFRNDLPSPYRRYAVGPVWRNEKPGPGRFRQFYQCDADTVGSASMAADAEMCAMLADVLENVGIARGDYIVRVNNRKVLNGILAGLMVDNEKTRSLPREFAKALETKVSDWEFVDPEAVLRTIDKFDKVGAAGVLELLTTGRKDQSGAFIEGVGLSKKDASRVVRFMESKGRDNVETLANLRELLGGSDAELRESQGVWEVGLEGLRELEEIADLLAAQGYGADRIVIDPSVVRGLGYYTGPIYEAELTFEILDEKGRKRQFGSVAGGGRYDDLVKRFTSQAVPATGISIGVDRLRAALEAKGNAAATPNGPVIVTVMDRDRMADYQKMVAELRNAGIRAEVYLGNPKNFGNQLKYADARNAPVAVIEGGDEHANGVVQVKDLALGKALAANITTNEEWKSQPAQVEISRNDLVAEVRKMIDRAG